MPVPRGPGRLSLSIILASAVAVAACGGQSVRESPQPAVAFETVRRVLQHPRCQNCHIAGDVPLQSDAGLTHVQGVVRGPAGTGARGMPCSTFHGVANPPASYGPHAPPGAPSWKLPPPEQRMVFKDLSAAELCQRLKDPARNGGKSLAALLEHVDHDPLVLWGWNPGPGRPPVPVPHAEFVSAFKQWAGASAPCP